MNKIIEASEAVAKAYAKWWLYTPDDFTNGYYAKLEFLRDALRAEVDSVEAEIALLRAKITEQNDILKMLAFPSYPIGSHIPEVFAAVGETPPSPGAKP